MQDRYFSTQEANGSFIWSSKEILNVTGYNKDEIIGINPYDHFFEEDYARILRKHLKSIGVIDEESIQDLKYRWRRKDGKYIWCNVFLTKYKDGLICLTIKMKWWEIILFKISNFFSLRKNKDIIYKI